MASEHPKNNEIPEMNLDEISKKYSGKNPAVAEDANAMQKEMEKAKKEIEKIKSFILKKYSFIQAIGILPPQAIKLFIEEEEAPKETEKHIHICIIIPEDKFKEIPKIKQEVIKEISSVEKEMKQKIWIHIKTPVDIWEICFDSKFEIVEAIAMSFPLYDKGILGALRVAEIHKSLVLQKFERYVVSYVIAGSLVRGESIKTSDVDVFIIINDTDIKRMSRLELKERLRGIIFQYVNEASALAGVKNKLSPQVYLLTDFWESVKDAHPVTFTFIRDGIPLYDRGTFMPWKALLKMGKLKPSPESIDMFMSLGDRTVERVKKTLLDIVVTDIYWSVITPSQAILMLYGLPPPTPKHITEEMNKIFVVKEKMLEKKYIDILEEIVIKYYKGYEHEKIKEVSGKEVDRLLKDAEDYMKRLKELREQIEKRAQGKTIEQIYNDIFELLWSITGKKSIEDTITEFEKKFVKTGKFTSQHLRILDDVIGAKKEFKKGKSSSHKIDEARKNASVLINDLIEYSQRKDLAILEKNRMTLRYNDKSGKKTAELMHCDGKSFLFQGSAIKKITSKIEDSNMDEVSEAVEKQKIKSNIEINPKVFEILRKEIGDFEITL